MNILRSSPHPLVIPVTIPQDLRGLIQICVRFLPIIEQGGPSTHSTTVAMPRSRGRKGPKIPATQTRGGNPPVSHAAPAFAQPFTGVAPGAKTEQRSVVASRDGWSEYTLDDGTVIKTRTALVDVKRVVDQYAPNGDPLYIIQAAAITNIEAKPELKRK